MLEMIVAMDLNNGIGKGNKLLCKIQDDMNNFVKVTGGNTVIMGRNTFASIGKPLNNRQNIVLSRNKSLNSMLGFYGSNISALNDIESVLKLNQQYPSKKFFIIGGEEVYKQFLPYVSKIHLTRILHTFEADSHFPELDMSKWDITSQEHHKANEKNEYPFIVSTLVKR